MNSLSEIYTRLRQTRELPTKTVQDELWDRWLWGTAVNQPLVDECGDMNMNQGVGILLCVLLSHDQDMLSDNRCIAELLPHSPLVHLTTGPILALSQRKLMDQVECLQLSWGSVVGCHEHLPGRCDTTLRLLMARLGHLICHAYSGGGDSPLDYTQYTTILPNNAFVSCETSVLSMYIVTRKYMRQVCCVLIILFRTLQIISQAVVVPNVDNIVSEEIRGCFQEHHLECSNDFFSVLQQMVQLAPGMRLVYRTDFSGMYNDVSQVVYYHYPQYHRQAQLPLANIPDSAINCLPLLTQLIPHVPVVYDDDDDIPGLTWSSTAHDNTNKFVWLVSCASVFLVEVDLRERKGQIMASPDGGLVPLIAYYVSASGTSLRAASVGGITRRKVCLASHSHVEIEDVGHPSDANRCVSSHD